MTLDQWLKKIDTLIISAPSLPELYRKLNTLQAQGKGGWQVQRAPQWIDGKLRAIVVRIDPDTYLTQNST